MSARGLANPPRYRPRCHGIDYGVLDDLTGFSVRRTQLVITDAFDRAMAGTGLTTQRFSALILISRNPGLKQTELARIMGIARSGMLAIVEALAELDLIEQRPSPSDRRAQALHLSAAGRQRLPGLIARVRDHDARVTEALSGAEIGRLTGLLIKLWPPSDD